MHKRFSVLFLVFVVFVMAVPASGAAQLPSARHVSPVRQVQAYPTWTFKPDAEIIPAGFVDTAIRAIGNQGELLVQHTLAGGVRACSLVEQGVATLIVKQGDTLPGGSTASGECGAGYVVSDDLFYLFVWDNLFEYLLRWENGTLADVSPAEEVTYLLNMNDAHGKFVAERSLNDGARSEYWITDGVQHGEPITLTVSTSLDQRLIGITADGGMLVHEGMYTAGNTQTRLYWAGDRTGEVASFSEVWTACTVNGDSLSPFSIRMNSAGDILLLVGSAIGHLCDELTFSQSALWLYPNTGGAVLVASFEYVSNTGELAYLEPQAITLAGQPLFGATPAVEGGKNNTLYSGVGQPLDADFSLFGQAGQPGDQIYLFNENGYMVTSVLLADQTTLWNVFAQAANPAPDFDWNNAQGGDWAEASNWSGQTVPGATDDVTFGLSGSYAVMVGTQQVGNVAVRQGSVAFLDADLDITGGLDVSGSAQFTLPEGELTTGELVVGAAASGRAPLSPLNGVAQVFISNTGTRINGAPHIVVGQASPGHLYLSGASIDGGALDIGSPDAPGSVVVANAEANPAAEWKTGAVAIAPGSTLDVERGGSLFSGPVVIGHAAAPEETSFLTDGVAVARLSNQGGFFPTLGNWFTADLALGAKSRGELYLAQGATLTVAGLFQAGLEAHAGPATDFDGFLSVDGSADVAVAPRVVGSATIPPVVSSKNFVSSTPTVASTHVQVMGDVLLGMFDEAQVGVNITRGGQFVVNGGNLSLGHEAGSDATVVVAGLNSHGVRATLEQIVPPGEFLNCDVGFAGSAALFIRDGGQVNCAEMRLGVDPDSKGTVLVDGTNGSSLNVQALCLGWDRGQFCESVEGAEGVLELRNAGLVSSQLGIIVGAGGRVMGDGVLAAGGLGFGVQDGGFLSPGITVLQEGRSSASLYAITPGTLSITGTLALSPTATIEIDVLGPGSYDRLVVTSSGRAGAANLLGGTLVIRFNNGYAPQTGDTFTFLAADDFTGAFDDVLITGLAPGFEYEAEPTNGGFALTALNDGVATTEWLYRVLLPLVKR